MLTISRSQEPSRSSWRFRLWSHRYGLRHPCGYAKTVSLAMHRVRLLRIVLEASASQTGARRKDLHRSHQVVGHERKAHVVGHRTHYRELVEELASVPLESVCAGTPTGVTACWSSS